MKQKIITGIFIVLFLTVSAFYIRLHNAVDRIFWDSVGWASIAGTCQAESDYFNDDIKKEHYENAVEHHLGGKGLLDETNAACWQAFSNSYNRRIDELQSEVQETEN